MNLQMDPLYNPLGTRPIQTGREMLMEPYVNRQFGLIDDPDRKSGSGSVPSRTRTPSDGPDPLLILMERDVRMYCNECDNCQRTKVPRHAKQGLLHPLESACKPWIHIRTNFITELPESEEATMILLVVDRFIKMAHFIPIKKNDSPTAARAYLENVWKYYGFAEDVVSDRDSTFSESFFTDLYNHLGIMRSMSTASHRRTDGQTERINQVIEAYLQSYCNYELNDWASMLAMAE